MKNSVHPKSQPVFYSRFVRRSIRGSDFRLSPISRSNHPGFYRVITPSYLADIFFFPPPPPFSTRRAEAQSTQLSPAGRRDLAIDLFFSRFANIRDFWLGAFPSLHRAHYSASSKEEGMETKFQKYEIKSNSRSNDRSTIESPPFFFRRK